MAGCYSRVECELRLSYAGEKGQQPLPFLNVGNVLLVFFGGVIGTAARALVVEVCGDSRLAFATLIVNVVGALGLGILLEAMARPIRNSASSHRWRLFVGTGFFGGFTTYSALALVLLVMFQSGDAWAGVGYGLLTVIVGAGATFLGVWLGSRFGGTENPDVPPAREDIS